ncbi:MAG: hypothetical protein NC131_11100 [Roseburia sp.]|nr:hypothetical protein [Roseburia sp.]
MSKKESNFNKKLNELNGVMTEVAKKIVNSNGTSLTPDEYIDYRREINKRLVEICLGAEFTKGKDDSWNVKLNAKAPDTRELGEVSELLGSYITEYERPLLQAFVEGGLMDNDGNVIGSVGANVAAAGMSIPARTANAVTSVGGPIHRRVTFIDDVSHKRIKEAVLGSGEFTGYLNMYLQVSDLVVMTANGAKLRKKDRRKKMMIIGGIVIVVAAGVGVGVWLYHKHKKSGDELADTLDVPMEDITLNCESDVSGDDAPVVTL